MLQTHLLFYYADCHDVILCVCVFVCENVDTHAVCKLLVVKAPPELDVIQLHLTPRWLQPVCFFSVNSCKYAVCIQPLCPKVWPVALAFRAQQYVEVGIMALINILRI